MKVLFLNPHRSDFVFESIAYSLLNRKSLKKYNYLKVFFDNNETDFLLSRSSFFRYLSKLHIGFLDRYFLYFEKRKFIEVNNLTNDIYFDISSLRNYDIAFCFGFSIREIPKKDMEAIAEKCNKIIIHLSHYHLYADKLKQWSSLKNVVFCADADIQKNYFYNFFVDNPPPFFVLSYTIEKRFGIMKQWDKRIPKIISTGTYHEFEKMFSLKQLKSEPISGIFGSLSLHPERRIIAQYASKLSHLECRNSSMGTIKIFNIIKKRNKINQSKYFSFDIVSLYNEFQYSFVGEESIAGLPGIGVFESVICGCIPIVNKALYCGTPLENENGIIGYSNANELISIIMNFDKYIKNPDLENIIQLSNKVREFYSPLYQLSILDKHLAKYLELNK